MEESTHTSASNTTNQDSNYSPGKQIIVGISVLLFFLVIGLFGYSVLRGNTSEQSTTNNPVLSASTNQISTVQNVNPSPQNVIQTAATTPTSENNNMPTAGVNKTCDKSGPAQKWEYLVPYTVKNGDTLQSIATTQLNDTSRVNEIIQLNGQGPYVIGSTLYLPPSFITKSSGNIEEVYGLLTAKDASYWHINYSADPNGIGVIIPTFWFNNIANSNSIAVGDCIKVLFDNGNKVYTVSLQ